MATSGQGHRPPSTAAGDRHVPGLDGVRGIAVLLVMVGHLGLLPTRTVAGGAGVTVFFVLSGYLISAVLLARDTGRGSRALFYGARLARLVPALVVVVVAAGAVWCLQGRPAGEFAGHAAAALFYVENLVPARQGDAVLVHTWSLAVEEQFYLLWPLVVPFLVRSSVRTRAILIGAAIAVSVASRFVFLIAGWERQGTVSLPVNAYALLAGCALALVGVPRIRPRTALVTGSMVVGAAFGIAMVVPRPPFVIPVVVAVGAVLLVVAGVGGAATLTSRPLRFAGEVSYSWYLWHWPLLWFTGSQRQPWPGIVLVTAALGIAALSTRCLEIPIRQRFRRWANARRRSEERSARR